MTDEVLIDIVVVDEPLVFNPTNAVDSISFPLKVFMSDWVAYCGNTPSSL